MAPLKLPPDLPTFLTGLGIDHRIIQVKEKGAFFLQETLACDLFYLQTGRVKLTVVSETGKEITVAMVTAKDFFGEESIATKRVFHSATATAIVHCNAVKIERKEVVRMMHQESAFAQLLMSFLLTRGMRAQADLVDQLSNSSEKRLARILLLMAETAKPGQASTLIPEITQETLADMVGTTRARVSKFMNGFRRQGLIDYKGRIWVHTPRIEVMLSDQTPPDGRP